ncbi:DDB1- and CUL4-associated factor 5-like isoform X1 [Portunus trituberculatus]|uniref:DDB1- and CUL4-associated factor 5-like isoform X1 n=1 Tax=Portunus trituberculatus TaxID=210409 RepID=UPI001E1CD520|nr:DDB1- and CUL4-associated factor 5-like isoform X1 [Portunus trituberculatus]
MKMKVSGRISELSSCSIRYLELRTYHSARPDWCSSVASSSFLSRRLNASKNLYSKDLYAHYGCVNAIEFSNEGDLLVSGGDDRRVLLWNVDGALSGSHRPCIMKGEHNSNIFCLSFDSSNTRIFSAGNDEQVIVHDIKTGETLDVFLHREAVYGVSVSPTSDSVFASAGEDGQVLLYDMREPVTTDPVCLARYYDAFHAVQFHPVEPLFIVTANSRKGVSLWDIRKPRVPVLRYGEKKCAQASICARFNRVGTQIIALRRRLPPVLYDTHSSKPVCQFDAEHYYNSCTMKSCCFAGDNDQFVLSGSDDFNLYMWKIPERNSSRNFVSEAHMVLKGHRSIVNEVRFNPQNFIIASSGVEKIVKLWSGLSLPGSKGNLKTNSSGNLMTRRVYTHDEYIGLVMESGQVLGDVNHDYSHGSMDEDPRMMAFFDSLVQREVEGWTSNTDLSDDLDDNAPGSGLDDDDTETTTTTTQSSLSHATSQSDDNDSDDEANRGPGHDSSDEQQAAVQLNQLQRQHANNDPPKNDDDDDDDDDEDEEDEREKISGGSEWIMHLIAKKRAKLRIAKRARRKRKHLRRNRKKTQHVLRSFTTQRRYLYHPGQNSVEEHPLQAELPGAVADSGGTFRRRTSYRRRYMAPYTIMVVHNSEQESEPESDEQENGNVSDNAEDNHTATEQQASENLEKVENGKRLLWSSDSESSIDNGLCPAKRKRTSLSESDSDSDEEGQLEKKNGQMISEIIDSNSSDSETEKHNVEANSMSQKNLNSEGNSSRSSCLPNILNDTTLSEESFGDSNGICDITSELNISSTVSDAIPISSISYDDNGSLLFETEHSSLVSGIDLPNTINMPTATTTKKIMQNGSNQSTNGTLMGNTLENVNVHTSHNVEKDDEELNGQNPEDNVADNTENSNTSDCSLKFKKRQSAFNVRNYRRRSEDEL